jgi:GT2 family glycosyltransferase
MPGVTIGIPTYNAAKGDCHRLDDLLNNLRQRTRDTIPCEIVVCDDSGLPGHQEKVKAVCGKYGAQFLMNEKNRGVPASWNRLTRFSMREVMVLLNDDVLVAKDWLDYLAYAIMENKKVGSVSLNCRFITASDSDEIIKGPDAKVIPLNVRYEGSTLIRNERFASMPPDEDNPPGRVMCPAGCAFGFRREVYQQIGGFDQRYFAFYEELDFGVSCAKLGMPAMTLSVPSDNYHIWSATFGSAPEIQAGKIMLESRKAFVEKWSKILSVKINDAPDIHNLLMDPIPPIPVKWLGLGKVVKEGIL